MKNVLLIVAAMFLLQGCSYNDKENPSNREKVQITIGAAASLVDVLEEAKERFEAIYDIEVTFTFGGSGKIAQQIERGAPIDLYIAANSDWVDYLEERNLTVAASRTIIATNRLVLITNEHTNVQYKSFDEIDAAHLTTFALGE